MALAILIHALIFLAFWLTNLPYQKSLNDFLMGATGLRADFLSILTAFAGLVALWSAARLALHRNLRRTGPAWLYLGVAALFLVFFYGSFTVLFVNNPAQLYRLGQLLHYFRLWIDGGILIFLAWTLGRRVIGRRVMGKAAIQRVFLPAGLLILWLLPIFWSPGNIIHGALPEKPRLIAHRGAPTLAPENTLASMQAAAGLGIYGLETDISVSADGVLFLMHDSTLGRTTNVARVFRDRVDQPAESFTWDELSRLDAGSWYAGRSAASEDPIPTLDDVLQVVAENDLHFLFDLRSPSDGHPYHDRALDLCLEAIQAADLAGNQVVNSVYSLSTREIHAYQDAGLWVNLWVVDEPWLFSRLWLAGVDSVTTNNVQGLVALSHPVFALPSDLYLLVWGIVGMAAVGVYGRAARYGHTPQLAGASRRLFPPR